MGITPSTEMKMETYGILISRLGTNKGGKTMAEAIERALRVLPRHKNVAFGDKEDKITVTEIIALLKYRIPAKVTHTATKYTSCTCPSCGNVIDRFMDWNGERVRIMDSYCHFCGQELDWGDE